MTTEMVTGADRQAHPDRGGDVAGGLGFDVIDADNHYYEPADCYTRHIEPRFRDRAIRRADDPTGTVRIMAGDRPFTFLTGDFPGSAPRTNRPGSLRDMLRNLSAGVTTVDDATDHTEPVQPAYVNRDARLELMDAQGIERCWLFPTLGVCTEHFVQDDAELLCANVRAFNRWLADDWGFAYRDRIHAVPLIPLADVDAAVAELEWALDQGAVLVHLRGGPARDGRSPADTRYDPFWARVNEAGIGVTLHIGESGYNEMMSAHWGEDPNPSSHEQSAFQWTCSYGDRVVMDTLASMIYWNLFGRFPNVRVATVEYGSLWVPYLLKAMDKYKGMGRAGPWPGGRVPGRPSEIFKQHVWVAPYHEEDAVALAGLIGDDHVLFGSDYPHPEGLASPMSYVEQIETLGAAGVQRVMRDNALEVMRAG
jgi:predicted TIM-barrel fold metal-dependent hydrolase